MKDPAFLFYTKDFYEGTRTMFPEERACYVDLLIYQHQNGEIPNDMRKLQMYCSGCSVETIQNVLNQKFNQTVNGWLNKRLSIEQKNRSENKPKKIASATLAGLISSNKLGKNETKTIKSAFKIDDFIYSENIEIQDIEIIKTNVKDWFYKMLNHLVKNKANVNADANANGNKDNNLGKSENPLSEKPFFQEDHIIDHLNEISGRQFKKTENNRKHIRTRISEGWEIDQLKEIIEIKTLEWKGNPEMEKYINPETLFRPKHIEKYWNQVLDAKKNPITYQKHFSHGNSTTNGKPTVKTFDPLDALDKFM